jgi:hypothetical protein
VTPADDEENSFVANTPTGCWTAIIKKVNESQGGKRVFTTVSGPEYFGLSNPKVRRLIEALTDAERCEKYERKFDNSSKKKKKKGKSKKSKRKTDAELEESQTQEEVANSQSVRSIRLFY